MSSSPRSLRLFRTLVLALAWLVSLGVGALGCARDARFELLSLDAPEITRLDAGRAISLTGRGFPVGRQVDVVLRGHAHGPLGARRRVMHTLLGRTLGPEQVQLPVSDADIASMGGRGTFVGSLEVVVHGAALDGLETTVVGALDEVRLELVPSERASARERARSGVPLPALLGLEVERRGEPALDERERAEDDAAETDGEIGADEAERPGVAILAVTSDGPGARLGLPTLGLAPGARIVSIDGMTVLDAEELRIDARASRVALGIERPLGGPSTVMLDLDAVHGRTPDRTTRYDQLAVLVLVTVILFGAWPWSRARTRGTSRPRDGKPTAAVLTASLALLVALATSTLPTSAWLHGTIPLWLATSLFLRASVALATRRDDEPLAVSPLTSRGVRGLARVVALLGRRARSEAVLAFVAALGASAAVGAFLAVRGSAESASLPSFGGPLASAPWMPMSWPLVRAPFGPFALACVLAAAGATSARVSSPTSRLERLLRGVDDLGLAALASVFVRVAIADPASTEPATRASALIGTALLYTGLLRARAAARGSQGLAATACLGLVLVTASVAAAWLSRPADSGILAGEQAVAEVVLACVGLLVVRVASLRAGEERAPTPTT